MKTVVVSGASGYIGQSLVRALEPNGVDVRTIGREERAMPPGPTSKVSPTYSAARICWSTSPDAL